MEKDNRKIQRISMVDQVSDGIYDLIQKDNLQPGDKLPTETELAELFGVNRFTVRMALQKLITIGIIETRVGEGSFVKRFSVHRYFSQISDIGFANEPTEDIYQLRIALEGQAIGLAIERATPAEMETLREKAEACRLPFSLLDDVDVDAYNAAVDRDIAFHQYLCVCSHNQLFEKLYALLLPQLREYVYAKIVLGKKRATQESLAAYDKTNDIHMRLYQAIADKDLDRANEVFQDMIQVDTISDIG